MSLIERGEWPRALTIGGLRIEPATVLAPMEGLSDMAFRTMIRDLGGCGLVVTEFVNASALTRGTRRALRMSAIGGHEHPIAVQIYGRQPDEMAESARRCEALGADIIDINMGCPSKAVTRHRSGVALMREPALALEIVKRVRAAISIPLSVKMRLGWDRETINAPELAHAFEGEGVDAVIVHGRTRADFFRGKASWEGIGDVKAAVRIPVIGNGDITRVEDALEGVRLSGVDAVMVGRGVLKDPWLLRRIGEAFAGREPSSPSLRERRRLMIHYFDLILEQFDYRRAALGKIKKVTGLFTEGVPDAAELRDQVLHTDSIAEAYAAVHRFFDRLEASEGKTSARVSPSFHPSN